MDLAKEIENVQNLLKKNKLNEALKICQQLLKQFPQNSYLNNLTGIIFQQVGRFDISKNFFLKAIELDSDNIRAKNNLANTFNFLGKFRQAEDLFKTILKIDPMNITCLSNYARLKQHLADYEVAIPLYEKAKEIEPKNISTLMNLAIAYNSIGKAERSIELIDQVIEVNPNIMSAHKFKSSMIKYEINNKHLNQMMELSKIRNLNDDHKTNLFFALGKAFEDIEDHHKAFNYYDEANKIMSKKVNFNFSREESLFLNIHETFKDIDLQKIENNKSEKKVIFICGMPRSGTTLIEQILSSHNNVSGAGELYYLQQVITKNFIKDNTLNKKKIIENLNLKHNQIYHDYCNLLKIHNFNSEIITDKAPQNFRWIGFIKLFFPNSKIVHCTRNPKDTCLSLFKNSFGSSEMNWVYSQEDIANYHNLYSKLMKFWKDKMPNDVYDINYENLIKNKDIEINKLLEFCHLSNDQSCFEHHKSFKTPIKSASVSQARKPINSSSVNKSEIYKKNLNQMFSLLH